jgi:heat-inducible transcriptional repressor
MVRFVDHERRKKNILNRTIGVYIQNATPVSSEFIAQEFDLSPATIRNIFAELEDEDYLTHPYTSAGRIPTDRGYRCYVDSLMSQSELPQEEELDILAEFINEISGQHDVVEQTCEIISSLSHYAGIITFTRGQDRFFYKGIRFILEQPEFRDIHKVKLLIAALEEKKRLLEILNREFQEPVKVYIGKELDCPQIDDCSLIISPCGRGKRQKGRIAILGPRRMSYERMIPLLEYISGRLEGRLREL